MDEILHHLGALNYCNSQDFRGLRWCKISSNNRRVFAVGLGVKILRCVAFGDLSFYGLVGFRVYVSFKVKGQG